MSNQFEFEPAYYLASVTQYVSGDGRHYFVGPIWECVKQIDGEQHFPVVAAGKGMEGRVYWCRETSRGRSCRRTHFPGRMKSAPGGAEFW